MKVGFVGFGGGFVVHIDYKIFPNKLWCHTNLSKDVLLTLVTSFVILVIHEVRGRCLT